MSIRSTQREQRETEARTETEIENDGEVGSPTVLWETNEKNFTIKTLLSLCLSWFYVVTTIHRHPLYPMNYYKSFFCLFAS